MTATRQVSRGGGCTPVWRKDGKELFYMAGHSQVMSADVNASFGLKIGPPKALFQVGEVTLPTHNSCLGEYGVTANGKIPHDRTSQVNR